MLPHCTSCAAADQDADNDDSTDADVEAEAAAAAGAGTSRMVASAIDNTIADVSPSTAIAAEYPQHFPLQDILKAWNPDDVFIPKSYPQYNSLKYFDFRVRAWAGAARATPTPWAGRVRSKLTILTLYGRGQRQRASMWLSVRIS